MLGYQSIKSFLAATACVTALATGAAATEFNIPQGDLKSALSAYAVQTGTSLVYVISTVQGVQTKGVQGNLSPDDALTRILKGTGFVTRRYPSGAIGIDREQRSDNEVFPLQLAQAALPSHAAVETVTVTSSKLGGADVQSIPISITALSQEQLTATQTAGGPDLLKQVPNMTFSKTNFTGYNIQIRGIGTQAISVTTDPAVAVALNDIPFIRNHFFEQEFYDLSQAEVLRGPQGTLYGRNATAGVVNIISAKPTDQFEATASADIGNFKNRRFEGMINLPLVDDRADVRIAGEWTKRDGYSFNEITGQPIDGRDLWSTRVTLDLRPTEKLHGDLVWEHFQENDDRLRSGKQLCKTDVPPTSINGVTVYPGGLSRESALPFLSQDYLSQGCAPTSLYSPDAFQVPYGFSLPYAVALADTGVANEFLNPYLNATQSPDLRIIESSLDPHYHARNDVVELTVDYATTPTLNLTSQTGFNQDDLSSTEDYNRFNTAPGIFLCPVNHFGISCPDTPLAYSRFTPDPSAGIGNVPSNAAIFCDPQLGCSDRLVAEDLSEEHAWQFSQELRLASNYNGPFNFSIGGNYLHYETEENYYVFINSLSAYSVVLGDHFGNGSTLDNTDCINQSKFTGGYQNANPILGGGEPEQSCVYIDPNSISRLNNKGHNYFLSQNPYTLNSYAGFGEAYYNLASDIKFTGGLRWTKDEKHFVDIPSEVVTQGYGYPITAVVDQRWSEVTGRAAANWTPKLEFTDQTLIYASYAHGYKAGGANPPGAVLGSYSESNVAEPIHPLTFKPEFINAYELGTKNTLLDGALTLNGDLFYYDYKDYQISEIVDRTSINLNFDTTVKGAELDVKWEPSPGLKFTFAGGYENTRINNGQSAIDLMDRTDSANHPDWMVVKPFVTGTSNCILPVYVVQAILEETNTAAPEPPQNGAAAGLTCGHAYEQNLDPATLDPYTSNPTGPVGVTFFDCGGAGIGCNEIIPNGYPGFDPSTAPNHGEGFAKKLGGNQLPSAPPFTVSFAADYTLPVTPDWAVTLHGDYYWQDYSWARVFNDNPYDRIRGYTNVNLALILTSQNGWQVMSYVKNVFDTTAITGAFLNSDDSGLTTNIFLTDPRLFGVRVTKNW